MTSPASGPGRKPPWLKVRLGGGEQYKGLMRIVQAGRLHTVCQEALCPNMGRCWERGRATLMILGDTCTRGCTFCGVISKQPAACDRDEPKRVAEAVVAMGLRDVVLTSVTRDDLDDGGAAIWAETIRRVRAAVPGIRIESLIPDFAGSDVALDVVLDERPDVLGHNLETVPALYATVRPHADYARSLRVLRRAHERGLITKTSLMLGLGETREAVTEVMRDARDAGCDVLYLGQYLQPTRAHLPVSQYVTPEEFDAYGKTGRGLGFGVVIAAPLVRSSYHSDEQAAFVNDRLAAVAGPREGHSHVV